MRLNNKDGFKYVTIYLEKMGVITMRNYYMVRAKGSKYDELFSKSVVAVGWSSIDFSKEANIAILRQQVFEKYYKESKSKQTISKKLNEVERFKKIKKDDYIVIPYASYIIIAVADSKEIYAEDAKKLDLANQRAVTYRYTDGKPMIISRNNLSEGLQRRLRVRGNTVSNLYEFKDEIENIFNSEAYFYTQEMKLMEDNEIKKLKEQLLLNIRDGKSYLQAGGVGLEKLVCEIMRCEGYDSKVLPKNKFKGIADADIMAIKEDSFMSKKFLLQIKHHHGYSSKKGIEQLVEVLKLDEYKDYDGYFITSGSVGEDVKEFAVEQGIEVMDGTDLVDLIYFNLNQLSDSTKYKLGICTIPRILDKISSPQ